MKNAFTMVELLITITVISVLAGIALPVMSRVKNQAQQSVSTSNLRQLVVANVTYAADHADRFCPAEDGTNLVRWHGSRNSTSDPFDATTGLLSDYLGKSRRIEICPGFSKYATGNTSFETGAGGYGYNGAYIGGRDSGSYLGELGINVSHPAETIMFATTAYPTRDGLQEYAYVEPFVSNDGYQYAMRPSMHFRFRGKALVAWCDGHVTAESQGNYPEHSSPLPELGWIGPSDDNGFWNSKRP